jgi:hypothetical protein
MFQGGMRNLRLVDLNIAELELDKLILPRDLVKEASWEEFVTRFDSQRQ